MSYDLDSYVLSHGLLLVLCNCNTVPLMSEMERNGLVSFCWLYIYNLNGSVKLCLEFLKV